MHDEPLGEFARACKKARDLHPTATIVQLQATLAVVMEDNPVGYGELGEFLSLSYNSIAVLIAQSSDGRGKLPGAGLLERISGSDRKEKKAVPTEKGIDLVSGFYSGEHLSAESCMRALENMRDIMPGAALGTFCIFMELSRLHANSYDFELGYSNGLIGTGINNIPKHMKNLSDELIDEERCLSGYGLIRMTRSQRNRRVVIPEFTDKGRDFLWDLSATLRGGAEKEITDSPEP